MILSSGLDQSRGVSILFSIIWLLLQTQGRAVGGEDTEAFPGWTATPNVRLVGGRTSMEGRVELRNETGEWGTICPDRWSAGAALTICRQLGFSNLAEQLILYDDGPHPLLRYLYCYVGDETRWEDCGYSFADPDHSCPRGGHAGVVCADVASESTFRLYGGDATSGRVEIFQGGRWGTVCNQAWDDTTDGDVLCRQLGYPGVITPGPHGPDPALMGAVDGPIHLTEIECKGTERSMLHCQYKDWDPSSGCNHSMDVFVKCEKPEFYTPRLYNGTVPNKGRLEVWDGTDWSRLCHPSIGLQGADTVCHELGLGYLWYLDNYTAPFGNGLAGVLDRDFVCQWGHRRLRDCVARIHGGWFSSCPSQTVTCSGTKLGFATLVGLAAGLCGALTLAIVGCMICYHARQNKRTSRATPEQIFADLGVTLPDRPRDVTVNDLSPRPAYTVEAVKELPHPSYEVAGFDADRYKTNYWHA